MLNVWVDLVENCLLVLRSLGRDQRFDHGTHRVYNRFILIYTLSLPFHLTTIWKSCILLPLLHLDRCSTPNKIDSGWSHRHLILAAECRSSKVPILPVTDLCGSPVYKKVKVSSIVTCLWTQLHIWYLFQLEFIFLQITFQLSSGKCTPYYKLDLFFSRVTYS